MYCLFDSVCVILVLCTAPPCALRLISPLFRVVALLSLQLPCLVLTRLLHHCCRSSSRRTSSRLRFAPSASRTPRPRALPLPSCLISVHTFPWVVLYYSHILSPPRGEVQWTFPSSGCNSTKHLHLSDTYPQSDTLNFSLNCYSIPTNFDIPR
jgi:hypothetical protein